MCTPISSFQPKQPESRFTGRSTPGNGQAVGRQFERSGRAPRQVDRIARLWLTRGKAVISGSAFGSITAARRSAMTSAKRQRGNSRPWHSANAQVKRQAETRAAGLFPGFFLAGGAPAVPAWWQRDVPNRCIVQITTDETSRVHFDCRRQAVMPRTESTMVSQVFCDISISADGCVAGPGQTAGKPFGDGPVDQLHAWMFDTPDENKAEIDQVVAAGAFVMGRNMFGPGRGEWDLSWNGWWGDNPPYHAP